MGGIILVKSKYAYLVGIFFILSIFVSIQFCAADGSVTISNSTSGGLNSTISSSENYNNINLLNGTYKGGNNNKLSVNSNKNLTIQSYDSNNKATIDCSGSWFINNKGNLTLKNLIIKNAGFYENGAVYNSKSLTIINCTFLSNTGFPMGAAIYNTGDLSITDSNFINNSVYSDGGAIYNSGNLDIRDSIFTGNKASGSGGDIYNIGNLTVTSSNFTNSSVNNYGGSIYTSGNAYIINSSFIFTKASFGGAVFVNGYSKIYNSTFINCRVPDRGGAIYNNDSLTLNNSIFNGNNASIGGSIFNMGELIVNNSSFNNSYVPDRGGAIFSNNNCNISNSIFTYNKASQGGAIFNDVTGYLFVSGNQMLNNKATYIGDSIYNDGKICIIGLTFLNNNSYYVENGQNFLIFANLTDNMGNPITGGIISFYLNNNFLGNVNVVNGMANLTYYVDITGPSIISGYYSGYYSNSSYADQGIIIKNGSLTNSHKQGVNITVSDVSGKLSKKVNLTAKLTDENGNPLRDKILKFYVNGVYYGSSTTNNQGVAKLSYTLSNIGLSTYYAVFDGDADYMSFVSSNASVSVGKGDLSVVVVDVSGKFNSSVVLNATVKNQEGDPVSGVLVKFYINGVNVGNGTTNGLGVAYYTYKVVSAGNFDYVAVFDGSADYNGNSSNLAVASFGKLGTVLNVTNVSGKKGGNVNLSASLKDENGNLLVGKVVKFYVNGVYYGSGTTDASGVARLSYSLGVVGSFTYYAVFDGETNYMQVTSSNASVSVGKGDLSVVVVDVSGKFNSSVVLNATVKNQEGDPVSGVLVKFYINGVNVGNGTTNGLGVAYYTYKVVSAGNFDYVAVFDGSADYNGNSSNLAVASFGKLGTVLNVTNVSGKKGGNVNLSASLKDENGNLLVGKVVKFYVNGVYYGSGTTDASGVARVSYSLGVVGSFTYYAVFDGETNYMQVTSSNASFSVGKGDLSVVVVDVSGKFNSSVVLNATVKNQEGDPVSGVLVKFYINGVNVGNGTTNGLGVAYYTYKVVSAGNFDYVAVFDGSADYNGNSSNLAVASFGKLGTVLNVTNVSGKKGGNVNLSASLKDENGNLLVGKVVKFYVNGVYYGSGTTDASGVARLSYSLGVVGSFTYYAVFDGETNYMQVTSSNASVSVGKGDLSVVVVDVSGKFNSSVVLNATVKNQEGDPVSGVLVKFYINGVNVGNGTTNGLGVAYYTYKVVSAGNFDYVAVFDGSADYNGNSSNLAVASFGKLGTVLNVTNVSGKKGGNVNLSASLKDENGNLLVGKVVKFYVNGVYYGSGTTDASGVARVSYSLGVVGSFTYYAVFDGETNYMQVTSSNASFSVGKGDLSVVVVDVSGKFNSSVVLNATVKNQEGDPVSGVLVKFYINGVNVGNGTTNGLGVAYYTYKVVSAGNFDYVAVFDGSADYNGNSSNLAVASFGKLGTVLNVTNVSGKKGGNVNLSASLKDENGNLLVGKVVKFYVNGVYYGSGTTDASGVARVSYSLGVVGSFTYYAVFDGETNYMQVTSSNATIIVKKGDLNITVSNISGKLHSSVVLNATVKNQEGDPVSSILIQFYIGGIFVGEAFTDANGVAYYRYIITSAGFFSFYANASENTDYTSKFTKKVLDNYLNGISNIASANFTKLETNIIVKDINGKKGSSVNLSATLKDENGDFLKDVAVKFYVNGVYYGSGTTDASGVARVSYSLGVVGSFTYYAVFDGNTDYMQVTSSNASVSVGKGDLSVVVVDVSGKFNSSVVLNATVKNQEGSPVSGVLVKFYINGVNVGNGTTNALGVAYYNYKIVNIGSFDYYAVVNTNYDYTGNISNIANGLFIRLNTTVIINIVANTSVIYKGGKVTFIISVTNFGLNNASNVIVHNILNSKWILNGFYISKGHFNFNNGIWNVGNLTVGESALLFINVSVNKGGLFYDFVYISISEFNKGLNYSYFKVLVKNSSSNNNSNNSIDPKGNNHYLNINISKMKNTGVPFLPILILFCFCFVIFRGTKRN